MSGYFVKNNSSSQDTFDYVIVGAGSAGCVLANRLSADPSVRVLLLEAGPPDTLDTIRVPALWSGLFGSEVDWDYRFEPQPHYAGSDRWSQTQYHPVGTCAMDLDEDSVVDPELRVRGVDSLRVIDASVMPSIIGGNTNATTIMIGENGADLVRAKRSGE